MEEELKQEKKRYWLKLDKDFLKNPQMKVLKNMPNGKDYIIFYLSLMLESVETVGHLRFTSLVPYNDEMLSAITDTNIDIVRQAIKIFCELGLMQIFDDGTIFMPQVPKMTGKECDSAERVRRFREREKEKEEKLELPKPKEPKTNVERQRNFRAKKKCEEQHIPLIEDYINNKRYNGNYYIVLQRDRYKCSICGSIENLCVHHIDGYNEDKKENSNINKMITLCRYCHSNIHAGEKIDEDILYSIDYYSNEMLPSNNDVTKCNDNKEKEKEKKENIYKEIIDLYNSYCLNLPKVLKITNNRKKKIDNFLKEFTIEEFKQICIKANKNDFLIGKNKNGWKADFDFFMRADKAQSILEGKYDTLNKNNNDEMFKNVMEEILNEN